MKDNDLLVGERNEHATVDMPRGEFRSSFDHERTFDLHNAVDRMSKPDFFDRFPMFAHCRVNVQPPVAGS